MMKVIISGATGMVGQGVLRECLTADDVEQVAVVGRTKLTQVHPKIHQVICPDLMHADQELERLQGFDARFRRLFFLPRSFFLRHVGRALPSGHL